MNLTESQMAKIKLILREKDMPMFTDEEIQVCASDCKTIKEVLFELLILKSENTAVNISGLTIEDTSAYFRRLAQTYRPHNTGSLEG